MLRFYTIRKSLVVILFGTRGIGKSKLGASLAARLPVSSIINSRLVLHWSTYIHASAQALQVTETKNQESDLRNDEKLRGVAAQTRDEEEEECVAKKLEDKEEHVGCSACTRSRYR